MQALYCIIRNRGPPVNNNKYKKPTTWKAARGHSQSSLPAYSGPVAQRKEHPAANRDVRGPKSPSRPTQVLGVYCTAHLALSGQELRHYLRLVRL